jgi:hypothetical protein
MTDRILIPFIILIGLLLIPAALAADNKVPHGGTVYVGEEDLDLSSCDVHTGDEIAWWDSGNAQGTPTARSRVTDVQHFKVDTDTFKGHTGQWYALITKKPIFTVEDPTLEVDMVENGMDTDPTLVKRGNLVSFKISTNLAGISQRSGSSGAPVTINLTGPNDTVYHTITSSQTGDFNLDKVYVYASPYDTGAVWDTADAKKFPDGDYTISAVTNVNKINDNNPDSGATVTEKKTYTLGKTGVKAKETEAPKTVKSSKDKSSDVTTESVTTEKKAAKKAENVSEQPTKKITAEPTAEKTSSKSSSKDKNSVDATETPTKSPTKKVTSEPTSEGKSNTTKKLTAAELENLTEKKTTKPTAEPTSVRTSVVTPIPTEEETDEPTPVYTPHPKQTYVHPPSPSATATQASPLSPAVIGAALGAAALLIGTRRSQ